MRDLDLASGFTLAGVQLRNRIVMAPMTREAAPFGVPTEKMARYYAKRAEGGAGLIITEGAAPNELGRYSRNAPCLYGQEALKGWEKVVAQTHHAGGKIFAQIWHVGALSPEMMGLEPSLNIERVSPSGLAAANRPNGHAMTSDEVEQTIADYGYAARNAREVGFDGVEIHAAHGYLPDQFFWADTNRRDDFYGGDLSARTRFAAALISECKARAGHDFPVILRLSQWKQLDYMARNFNSPEELSQWLLPLTAAGLDAYHVSTRRFWDEAFSGNDETLAGWVRRRSGLPVIAVGSALLDSDFKTSKGKEHSAIVAEGLQRITDGLRQGSFDLMAFGRLFLANPDLAKHLKKNDLSGLKAYDRKYLDTLA